MKYELIDCKPVPAKLAPAMRRVRATGSAVLTSCARNQEAVDFARRMGCTLSSQVELYAGWVARRRGFNPANPPGRSTHEFRNDGVAYAGRAGSKLRWWQVGQDWGTRAGAEETVREYARLGFTAAVTYPGNPREGHHINLRKMPRIIKPFPILKRGSRGARVKEVTRRLAVARTPGDKTPYLPGPQSIFDAKVWEALRRFQKDHGQKADGIYGRQTARQLAASYRYWKDRLRARKG